MYNVKITSLLFCCLVNYRTAFHGLHTTWWRLAEVAGITEVAAGDAVASS